jgi:hypothetical protein
MSAVHISGMFTICEQLFVSSAGPIAGPFWDLVPERKRLTGFEGARSASDFAGSIPKLD